MPTRVAETGLLTATTLTIIAILAIITSLGILWGMRLKHKRNEADRIELERVEHEGGTAIDADTPAAPTPSTPATPTAPPAVAPSPPPLDDGPVIATPAPEPSVTDEPVAAAPMTASPASEAAAAPVADLDAERPVTQIKGLGPKVAARLAELGLTNVGQIAALDTSAAERLDAQLGAFTGRMARDRWIEQARFLAAGDVNGFEAVFGRL